MPDSSPENTAQAAVADTTVTTTTENTAQVLDVTSASSTDTKAGMLDAVKSALAQTEASPASTEPGTEAKADDQDSKTDASSDDDELSDEELKALSQRTHKRFKRLSSEVRARKSEIESLRPKAEEFEKIDRFVRQSGLTNEDVGFFLTVGALAASGKPDKALEQLLPWVQRLQAQAGDILPSDLQERVRLGYITEQDARELSRARSRASLADQRATQTEEQRRLESEQRTWDDRVSKAQSAAEKWESSKAERDPDWHLKRNEVADKVKLAILEKAQQQGGRWFPDAAEIVAISDKALEQVNKLVARRNPTPGEIRPVNPGGAAPRVTPKPTSMLDVVRNAVA